MLKNKKKSLGINAFLNAVRCGLSVLFPLITYPYAFRVLHAEGIGKVNYALSVEGYFGLLAALGISTYAVREGAKLRYDRERLGDFCCQIFSINFITTIFAYLLLLICAFNIETLGTYKPIMMVLSLSIAFSTFGVEWINTIYEDFLYITIRSIIVYILTLILLFVFVKDQDDILQYAFVSVSNSGLVCLLNWFYCKRYVRVKLTKNIDFGKHIKPILTIFMNSVATSIYVNADTTMLGIFSGDYYVGLYALAVKIYNVVKTMLAAIYTVAIPRISYYIGENNINEVRRIYTSIFTALTIILLPAGVGLAAISKEIVLIMGGVEYLDSVLTLQILAFSLIGAIFGGLFTYCLNIPIRREHINVKATSLGALINVILNMIMIPIFKHNGAAITTLVAEFFVLIYCILKCKDLNNYLDLRELKKKFLHSLLGCATIVLVTFIVKNLLSGIVLRIILIIVLSIIAYGIELIALKNTLAVKVVRNISAYLGMHRFH